ncbi:MAG TPA: hypothetical protein DEG06_05660 [Lachnospiraceae bacterium]|jgi:magnesium-transporting ATPase (P-type)|nr:hypothetical protein [Lachnospiraceae bacterium]HCA69164.1 hypothetical protein [Lachnospiraceae bacterium]HCM13617.1 hypothetical protein [Lachnospiraceae bacterium]HCR40478.1 hypothetical protein [Lachnospiraceae bacterium]
MNNDKKTNALLNILTTMPCILSINIFLCFRFADWRKEMPEGIQTRILAGSIFIVLSFILYYGILFYLIKKYYNKEDKYLRLFYVVLMVLLVIISFVVGYFIKY